MKKPEVGDLVKVSWIDIGHTDSDIELEELEKLEPCPAITVGWLMVINDKKVVITSTKFTEDKTYRCTSCFPRGIVRKIIKLEEAK